MTGNFLRTDGAPALRAVAGAPDWYVVPGSLIWERLRMKPLDVAGVRPRPQRASLAAPWPYEVHRTHLPLLGIELPPATSDNYPSILRPYQRATYDFIRSRRGSLVGDEQRVGKTVPTLYALDDDDTDPMLVIGPLASRGVWHEWAAKRFGACLVQHEHMAGKKKRPCPICDRVGAVFMTEPSFHVLEGRDYADVEILERYRPRVLFCTFAVVSTWRQLFAKYRRLSQLAIDEAHLAGVQNRKSQTVESLRWLNAVAERVIAITGTPLYNKVKGLWPLFDIAAPASFGGFWDFARRYCNPPEAPIWMGDLSFKPLGEVRVGDEVIGWADGDDFGRRAYKRKHKRQTLRRARVLAIHKRRAPLVKVTFASGRTLRCTADHRWLSANKNKDYFTVARVGHSLCRVVDPTPALPSEKARVAGWLAGIWDGEGTGCRVAQYRDANPEVWQAIQDRLCALSFSHTPRDKSIYLTGGRNEYVRFLNWVQPVKRERFEKEILLGRFRIPDRIVSIEPDGEDEVISMTTSTGNYVAWGYASKNCGARPGAHGWQAEGETHSAELRARMSEIMLRRTWRDVQPDLPPMTRSLEMVALSQSVKDNVEEAAAQVRYETRSAKTFVGDLARLRKMYAKEKTAHALKLIREQIDAGRSVVAWAWHTDVADTLFEKLSGAGVPVYGPIYGATSAGARERALSEAERDTRPRVIVANILSLSTAVSLAWAPVEVFVELDWVPVNIAQAEMRIVDGKSPRQAIYCVADVDADERLAHAVIHKLETADKLGLKAGMGDVADVLAGSLGIEPGRTLDDLARAVLETAMDY